jgi:hypothetical protein
MVIYNVKENSVIAITISAMQVDTGKWRTWLTYTDVQEMNLEHHHQYR